jgi:hypothetical protein
MYDAEKFLMERAGGGQQDEGFGYQMGSISLLHAKG